MKPAHTYWVLQKYSVWQILIFAAALLVSVAVINRSSLPFVVVLPAEALSDRPADGLLHKLRIILPDDVMISLRAAVMHAETGRASLNSSDISQPATSYVYPILLSIFSFESYPWVMPLVAVAFGLLSLLGCAFLIFRVGILGAAPVPLWWLFFALFNASTLQYAFSGWEHLPQAFFVVLSAVCLIFAERQGRSPSISILVVAGFGCAASFLFRADSFVLFAPWLLVGAWYVAIRSIRWLCFLLSAAFTAVSYLAYQWNTYGHLLPTTARLKAGAVADWSDNALYILTNFVNGSAVAVTALSAWFLWRHRPVLTPMLGSIALSLLLFLVYGFTVSDVFPYARMFIPAAMLGVLAATIVTSIGVRGDGVAIIGLDRFLRLA
jgi:hypothetical protein